MILIPGLSVSGTVWTQTAEHFKSHYECHILTLAGFAGQAPIDPPFLETVRKQLAQYIREKNLSKPVVVGHSLGGFLGLWLASTEPDLVGPVVSVDGVPFLPALFDPNATAEKAAAQATTMRDFMASMTREQFAAQNRMSLSMMITAANDVDFVAGLSEKSDPKTVAQAMLEIMSIDLRPQVSLIQSPVLLIGAGAFAQSPEMRLSLTEAYEGQISKIPRHRFVLAEKARHFVMLDDPQFFLTSVDNFLNGTD